MEPVDLLCSRNARPEKAVVGRAQWEINQPPSPPLLREQGISMGVIPPDDRSGTNTGAIPGERSKRAWKDHAKG